MPGGKGEARHQELKGIICQANSACNLLSSVSIFSVDFESGALPLTYCVQGINGVLKSCPGPNKFWGLPKRSQILITAVLYFLSVSQAGESHNMYF